MVSRRKLLKSGLAAGAGAFFASKVGGFQRVFAATRAKIGGVQNAQIPLPGINIPQFVDPLPRLDVLVSETNPETQKPVPINLYMREFQAQVLPTGLPKTYVWGYLQDGQHDRGTYLGPVIIAQRGYPTEIKFVNELGNADSTNVLAYKFSTDQTLHWADPDGTMAHRMAMPPAPGDAGAQNYSGSIPAVPHLHGGEVPPVLDGGPDAWVTSDGSKAGAGFYSKDGALDNSITYCYPNSQEAAPIWFHDHTLGATRLNVYAGLAGGYLIIDPFNGPQLADLPELVPLIIQDRMFDTNGELFFTAGSNGGVLWALNPEHPYWNPEFLGDVICVNGKAWPYLDVQAKRYTFLLLNGSNARAYEMFLFDPISRNPGPAMWVIGTDGGYLDKPVLIGGPGYPMNNKMVFLPGERYQVIVDFAGFEAGMMGPNGVPYSGTFVLRNTAKSPYPGGASVQGATTGQIMQFRVTAAAETDNSFNPAAPGAVLRGNNPIARLVNTAKGTLAAGVVAQKTRQLTLNEVMGMPQNAIDPVTGVPTAFPGGPLEILVNNTKFSGERIKGATGGMYDYEARSDFDLVDLNGAQTYVSEMPVEGETEIWEIVNLTADAHPIHLHLVQYQLMNRQNFDLGKYNAAYAAAFPGGGYDPMTGKAYPPSVYIPGFGPPLHYKTGNPKALGGNPDVGAKDAKGKLLYLKGSPIPPLPHETGWKDTIISYPGQVTRIVVRWAPTDLPATTAPADAYFPFDPAAKGAGYVWHCHIVDHEDNEMMRPDYVVSNQNAQRIFDQGTDY